MPIDRAATLRQAEKLLRQGRLDEAIAEYERLVEDQPGDGTTGNLLADLLLRAGRPERAIEHLTRVADGFLGDGYLPRASAVYKRILKLRPDSDHALMRAGEVAAKQGLLVDARAFFGLALDGRRTRGDAAGAWRVVACLGSLDRNDIGARLASAGAWVELGDVAAAIHELHALADMLIENGRESEALVSLGEIARLDATDAPAVEKATRILEAQGRYDQLAAFLTKDVLATQPAMLSVAASARLRLGQPDAALDLIAHLLEPANWNPAVVGEIVSAVADRPDLAYGLVDRGVVACVERRDWSAAAGILKQWLAVSPGHVVALARLIEVCVDGSMADEAIEAQGLLADAHLAAGTIEEARSLAEDLLARQPWEHANAARLRAVLQASGEAKPDEALARWLADRTTFGLDVERRAAPAGAGSTLTSPDVTLITVIDTVDDEELLPAERAAPGPESPRDPHSVEVDLSTALDEIRPQAEPESLSPPEDIEQVFADLRERVDQDSDDSGEVTFVRARAFLEAGDVAAGEDALRLAARSPRRRFAAALLIARICRETNRKSEAAEWLGHAVEAPAPTQGERYDALLGLADLLEESGEPERALAVCLELRADAGDYKDVAARLVRLSSVRGGG